MVGDRTDAGNGARADLVLEAGGVRGLGLVGAVAALASAGYSFPRVAGTSAGAATGAVVAASVARVGVPVSRLEEISRSFDTARRRDRGRLGRLLGQLGFLGEPTRVPTRRVRGLVGLAPATAETALVGAAARDFLSRWDEPAYLRHCRGVAT